MVLLYNRDIENKGGRRTNTKRTRGGEEQILREQVGRRTNNKRTRGEKNKY